MGCSWEGHWRPGPSTKRDVAARGERNHGRDSPIVYHRGNVGHGLLVARSALPRTTPTPDRPKSFFCFFALLDVVSAISGPLLRRFPLFWAVSWGLLVAPWWCRKDLDHSKCPNLPWDQIAKTRRPVGATRKDPKGRPKQRETHEKKAKQKRETPQTVKQKRDFGVLPAQTAPHTAPCPGGPFRRRKDPSRNAGFLTTPCRQTFSERVQRGVAQALSTGEAIIGPQLASDTVDLGRTTPAREDLQARASGTCRVPSPRAASTERRKT